MIRSAARHDRRFFKLAQAGRGLARVENLRARGAGRFDELVGQGRDAAEALEKIERDSFRGENRARATANFEDGRPAGDSGAILVGRFRPEDWDRPVEKPPPPPPRRRRSRAPWR